MISLEIDYPKAKKESQGKRANPAKITVIEVVEAAYMAETGISDGQHNGWTMQGSRLFCSHVAKSVMLSIVAPV